VAGFGEVVKVAVEFLAVTTLTILAERYLSTRAAFSVLAVSIVILCWFNWNWLKEQAHGAQEHRLAFIIACVVVFAGIGGLVGAVLTRPNDGKAQKTQDNPPPTAMPEKPPTLGDFFNKDFSNTMKATDDLKLIRQSDNTIIHVKRQVYLDFDAKTEFVGFYVPSTDPFSDETFKICRTLVEAVQPAIENLTKKVEIGGGYKEVDTTLKDLVFSGRVFLYHEGSLSIPQKADLINAYKSKNYDVQFRGLDYLGDQIISWRAQHDAKQSH
jgi:hypothetical protein